MAVTRGVALIGTSVSFSATTALLSAVPECTSVLRYCTQLYYHFLCACINFVIIIQVLSAQTVVAKQLGGIERECRDIPHPAAITASDMSEMRCYIPPSRRLKRQPSSLSMHSL